MCVKWLLNLPNKKLHFFAQFWSLESLTLKKTDIKNFRYNGMR